MIYFAVQVAGQLGRQPLKLRQLALEGFELAFGQHPLLALVPLADPLQHRFEAVHRGPFRLVVGDGRSGTQFVLQLASVSVQGPSDFL